MDANRTLRFEREPDTSRVLVVGIDGSETSWRALYYAFGLARRQRGAILAVFADPSAATFDGLPTTVASRSAAFDGRPDGSRHARDALVAELHDAIYTLSDEYHVAAEFITTKREPVDTLVRLAAERRAEAIVVGASQSLAHKLFGSTAVRTVRRSRCCPVTVVP